MDRRNFLRMAAASGMTLGLPMTASLANAAPNRFWVSVHASGGWDPTILCDPKGDAARSDGRGAVNNFATADIRNAGSIAYAPASASITDAVVRAEIDAMYDTFFQTHAGRLLVINGVDTRTNSHSTGTRTTWSGSADLGMPAFAALAAAASAPNEPMSFLTNGGYDYTDGIVAAARVSGSGQFSDLANPNHPSAGSNNRYLPDTTFEALAASKRQRLEQLMSTEQLPQRKKMMSDLFGVRSSGRNNLDAISQKLEGRTTSGLKGQAEMAVAAFSTGLGVSANLVTGGFDTHGNHDTSHYPRMRTLLDGVHHLWTRLEEEGLADRTTVVISSDFGRTPYYNSGNGKDHWNVTSVMAMGAGIRGGRTIGATDPEFRALRVNPQTFLPDSSGIVLTPGHVHRALRRLAGIESADLDRRYPIQADTLNLFS
ncbi:DUF1501 domain-containing protein [Allohahella marinimesophila]|uniref:Tat pathway signal protein n=1 Tax=Allohahella marinimesophila TaxID=1054972 RepID=A0ABP7PAV4_9GAMM